MHFWVNKCTFVLFRAYFIRAKEYAEKNTTLGRATSILHQFNVEEHLNRFSCNFFRQFKYTIAGVLPIVRYSLSALWQMNSRNFLQVKRHLIERLWEPEKKKKFKQRTLSQAISGRTWTSWRGCGWTAVPPWANGSWSATFSYRKEKCN